jgi:hypothetical protein
MLVFCLEVTIALLGNRAKPSSPPVEFCPGTTPIQATNSRPVLNAFGSVIVATTAVERIKAWNRIQSFAGRVGATDLSDALVEPAYFDLHGVQLRSDRLTGKSARCSAAAHGTVTS